MRVGSLNKLVTIQKPIEVQETSGELNVSFIDLAKEWASIEPLNGREFFAAQQAASTVSVRIRIRYRRDVTSKMRILYKPYSDQPADVYEINAVINSLVGNRELQLMCTRVTAQGLRRGGSDG